MYYYYFFFVVGFWYTDESVNENWILVEQFVKYFERYGEIIDLVIMKNRHTGRPRGSAFITYADPTVVDTVIAKSHIINDKLVDTVIAQNHIINDKQVSSLSSAFMYLLLSCSIDVELELWDIIKLCSTLLTTCNVYTHFS